MNAKSTWKRMLDCLMVVVLPLLMAYSLIGEQTHEWLGAVMFLLSLGHHVLNWRWYRSLRKGKWTARRLLQTIVNAALLLCMLGLIVSGVVLSRYVFDFLPIKGGQSFARTLHMLSAYWGFCMMSLHLGMHWNMVTEMLQRRFPLHKRLIQVMVSVIASCGALAFFRRQFPMYLFLKTHFVFFDFEESISLFFLDHIAVLCFFAIIGHYMVRILSSPHHVVEKNNRK
mgnify:FL=1